MRISEVAGKIDAFVSAKGDRKVKVAPSPGKPLASVHLTTVSGGVLIQQIAGADSSTPISLAKFSSELKAYTPQSAQALTKGDDDSIVSVVGEIIADQGDGSAYVNFLEP